MTIKQHGGIFGRNPTFNDVTVEGSVSVPSDSINGDAINGGTATLAGLTVDTNTLHVDATNDAVLVGTTSFDTTYQPRLAVSAPDNDGTGGVLVTSYKPSVTFYDLSGGTPAVHRIAADSGKLSFEVDTAQDGSFTEAFGVTATGNIAMANGQGIDFSATAGTGTSELFSDYEEGSWTPVVEGTTTAGTATYPRQGGLYTKIGNRVFVVAALVYNTHTGTGNTRITGLPYTVRNTDTNRVFIPFYGDNLTITGVPIAQFVLGQSYINVKALENGSDSSLTIDAAATLYITGSYEV
jgi:hypothetical protein